MTQKAKTKRKSAAHGAERININNDHHHTQSKRIHLRRESVEKDSIGTDLFAIYNTATNRAGKEVEYVSGDSKELSKNQFYIA